MKRRDFLKSLAFAAAGCALPSLARAATDLRRPNFIVILADDLGYGDLGCYGSRLIRTPRLDAMAAQGVRFTDFYSAASICTPSRAALLTGSYPQRCGLYMGINPNRDEHKYLGLHPDEITLPELLRERGYATLCVGKWHLGGEDMFHPMNHGFDEYFGMPFNYNHSPVFMDGKTVIEQKTDLTTLTSRYTRRVVDFIKRKKDQPFFIYLPHTYPHTPIKPNPNFAGKSKAGAYGDVIEEIDWSAGVILDTLKELRLDERTMVIFTSDNGPTPNAAKAHQSAGELQGSKYTSWEGGQREPAIFRWPGKIPPGRVRKEMAWSMDILPTLAKLAGAKLPADRIIDGKDIWPLLSGQADAGSPHETLFFYNCDHLQAVRWKHWKLHLPRTPEMVPWWQKNKGLRELKQPFLVDLQTDIAEQRNVAKQNPEVVDYMLKSAQECRRQLGDFAQPGKQQRPTGIAPRNKASMSNK